RRRVELLPAIVVNYITASAWGIAIARPFEGGVPVSLLLPAAGLGALFIGMFYLTGLSARRAGIAATSVASKMSLVLTVLFAVLVFGDRPTAIGWAGIALALIAVPLASFTRGLPGARGAWLLPVLLFLGNAAIDISLNAAQRELLTPQTEALFTTIVFAAAGLIGLASLAWSGKLQALRAPRSVVGGVLLGSVNHASLMAILMALARSGFAPSSLFPLMNIGVILFATGLGIVLFGDRVSTAQWAGIALAIAAMALLLNG
ncbi:MAG: hypothetical protein ACK4L7_07185, partial [Flavobacteriales bacterium]